jgi:hypothetical protein
MFHSGGGGGWACGWAEGVWEFSVSSTQFNCEPKTSLKHEAYLNREENEHEVLIHSATWMYLKGIVLSDKSNFIRSHAVRFHLHNII